MATFGNLSDRLAETFKNLRTKGKLTPAETGRILTHIGRAMANLAERAAAPST